MAQFGFIGMGNMGSAILNGLLRVYKPEDLLFTAAHKEKMEAVTAKTGVVHAASNAECAKQSEYVILAVKPQYFETVFEEIRPVLKEDQIVISLAPGQTIASLTERLGGKVRVVRTMPNTPALVGEGMTGVCCNEEVTEAEMQDVLKILESCGKAEMLSERLIDVVVSVSGSSPAYVFMFIEAMADAAVADGMPRAQAYRFAAQAVLGSAKMVLETGKHPGELKDMVCSPGGTTIEAVRVLEEKGMRSAVIEAMKACVKKGREM